MSAVEVELLREMYSRRSLDEFGESLHPDAEMHQAPEIPDTDVYRGREEFLRGLAIWLEPWERFRYVPEEISELPDGRVLVKTRLVGRAKSSGVELDQLIYNLWTFRDGKPFRCDNFFSEEAARQAAGLADTSA